MRYRIFARNWWKEATVKGKWPNDLEPDTTARKTHICYISTEAEASRLCHAHNLDSNPGRYSRKYEYGEAP